jgi:hypothetical protein
MPHRAFEEVVLPQLEAFNYARWLTNSDADAEDVVQDATVRALRFFSLLRNDDGRSTTSLAARWPRSSISAGSTRSTSSCGRRPTAARRLTDARAVRGFQVRHWTRDGMAFWATSDLNDTELDQFVHHLEIR